MMRIFTTVVILFMSGPLSAGPQEDLTSALTAYFQEITSVQSYDFLRHGPTVTGIAFPKYYFWVSGETDGSAFAGAIRVADQNGQIVVTDFLSAHDIVDGSVSVTSVFPQALVSSVFERANAVISD